MDAQIAQQAMPTDAAVSCIDGPAVSRRAHVQPPMPAEVQERWAASPAPAGHALGQNRARGFCRCYVRYRVILLGRVFEISRLYGCPGLDMQQCIGAHTGVACEE